MSELYYCTQKLGFMSAVKNIQMPTNDEIAIYAYHLWDSEGRAEGRDVDYWLQAEAHLIADREYEAGLLKKSPMAFEVKAPEIFAPAKTTKTPKKRSGRSVREPAYA